jgi:hypothetical protein
MLEIGLDTGSGSLLWKEYFPCAELYGLEYDASKTGSDGARIITAILGDQSNQTFLETDFLAKADGKPFDVIVDDGGHHYEHQVTSYKVLFDKALKPGGLYLMEDIETSYHKTGSLMYGRAITRGGQSETKTVINQFKQLVDVVNKKFFDNSFTVFGPVDHWIATVGFMSNLIILTKKDKSHCFAEMQYVWPERLADDCPAAQQPIEVIKSSPMVEYCGDHIVRRDKGYLRRDEPSLNLEWVMDAYSSDNLVEKELSEKLAKGEDDQPEMNSLQMNGTLHELTRATDGFYWRQPRANPDQKPQRTLVSIHTSHNAWNMCRMMLLSLASVKDKFDVIMVDDKSDQYDQDKKAEDWGIQPLRWGEPKDSPKGNTYTWNLAWQYAIENKYENIIIANNDLLIPNGTVSTLEAALDSGDWDWVNPIVSKRGSGYPMHTLPAVYGKSVQDWTDHPLHYSKVSDVLGKVHNYEKQDVVETTKMNGYAMAFKIAKMKKFQFDSSANLLFNPEFKNVRNEDDLRTRMTSLGGHTGVHTRAFVFHYKGFTLFTQNQGKRDSTDGYPVLDDTL